MGHSTDRIAAPEAAREESAARAFARAACLARDAGAAAAAACDLLRSEAWDNEREARAALEGAWSLWAASGLDLGPFAGMLWASALCEERSGGFGRRLYLRERLDALARHGARWPEAAPDLEERLYEALLGGGFGDDRVFQAEAAAAARRAGARLSPERAGKVAEGFEIAIRGLRGRGQVLETVFEALEEGVRAARALGAAFEAEALGAKAAPGRGKGARPRKRSGL